MIIFLYGPDTYRSRQKLNEIVEHYKKIHKSGLNLKIFDLKEKNFENFKEEIQSLPMLAERKLIVLKNASLNKDFREKFLKGIRSFSNSKEIILFYEEGEIPEDIFFNSLKKFGKFQEFKLLENWQLRNWLLKELANYRVKIEKMALEKLIEFVGNDLWRMENEIKKIVAFKNKGEINLKDVETLIRPKIEIDIFRTIDAIASKNKKIALKLIKAHLERGEKVSYLFSMIKYQFRNLLVIKDLIERKIPFYRFSEETKLHPFVIKKSIELARKFELSKLKMIYQKIFEIDLAIKSGKIEPEIALDLFVATI
jgi:DNA polymerase-3 subunit delta